MSLRIRLHFFGSVLLLCACGEAPAPVAPPAPTAKPEFAGSLACESCHETQYSDWSGSHHDLAMQVADAASVLGDFDNATADYFGTQSHFLRDGDKYIARTQNANGEIEDFTIAYTYGVTPLQQYLVEFDNGHVQPLPFAWDARSANEGGQRWYHLYPDEYIGPDDPLFWTRREQNWNFMCAECHSTNVRLNYDVANDTYATTWSEINVGCEACHGPGSNHISAAQAGTLAGSSGLLVDLDDHGGAVWQMNLATGIAERSRLAMTPPQQPESCGRCHARRGLISEDYEYGQPLAHTHRPALLNEPLYYPDGQIREEVYVYGSFLQSRMYQVGVTCSDCHNPHSQQLRTGPDPDLVCAQCHLPGKFAATSHHQHEVGQVACVDCHMPSRIYMGVDPRRDHSLRIPRPGLSLISEAPNACTMCHQDQAEEWAAEAAENWWGGPKPVTNVPPGIVRATVLGRLPVPLQPSQAATLERALGDPNPLVRIGALRAAAGLPPESQLQMVVPLLDDDVRGVRIEAVSLLASFRGYLPPKIAASFAAAADEFRAAQMAVASRPQAHIALAEFEADLGDIPAALAHADQAARMAPDMALIRHSRGLLLVRADRKDEALAELREAARLAPEVGRFVYVYAVALNSLGYSEDAIRVLQEAIDTQHPDDPDIANFLQLLLQD